MSVTDGINYLVKRSNQVNKKITDKQREAQQEAEIKKQQEHNVMEEQKKIDKRV